MAAEAIKAGDKAFSDGKYLPAVSLFTEAIARLHSKRSKAYAALQFDVRALSDAEKAVEHDPSWAKGLARLAAAQLRRGDRHLAIDNYKKALSLDPGNDKFQSDLAAVRRPRHLRRAVRNCETLIQQLGDDCWAVLTQNLVKIIVKELYQLDIYPDMSKIQENFNEQSDDSSTFAYLAEVLQYAEIEGFPMGPDHPPNINICPIVNVVDVSADKYDDDKIHKHMKENGVLLVSYPINEAFASQPKGRRDVQDLTHLHEEVLLLRMYNRHTQKLSQDDLEYLEEARKKKKQRRVGKEDRFKVHHVGILCGRVGGAWLVKAAYEEGFGQNNVVKIKVIFSEIVVVKWRERGSPGLFIKLAS